MHDETATCVYCKDDVNLDGDYYHLYNEFWCDECLSARVEDALKNLTGSKASSPELHFLENMAPTENLPQLKEDLWTYLWERRDYFTQKYPITLTKTTIGVFGYASYKIIFHLKFKTFAWQSTPLNDFVKE